MSDFAYERLSQLDRSFLIYEDTGPSGHMHLGATLVYEAEPFKDADGHIDVERVRRYVESRLHRMPRYRQRLARIPIEGHPIWVDDEHFNVSYHVRHTRLPEPGDERQLKRAVGRIQSQRLDRGKPLWELWLVEGVAGDRLAIVSKTHHCMVDGLSGVDLISVLMSPEPVDRFDPAPPWLPQPGPTDPELVAAEALRRAKTPLRAVSGLWRLARGEGNARRELLERVRATGRFVTPGLLPASSTPLNQPIGSYRRFDWLSTDLDRVRAVKNRLGGSVNDVVLATVTGALRRFLSESRDVDVDALDFRVLAPVSLRAEDQRGLPGNRVSAWVVRLPLAERDPRKRFLAVHATTEEMKRTRQALGGELLARLTEYTGSGLFSVGARLAKWARPFNLVVTNVPGPQVPLYLLGARLLSAFPMVPLFANLATGIALFSYDRRLHWGVVADWDVVPDLHDFTLAIEVSFRELCEAAGLEVRASGAPAARAAPPARETEDRTQTLR
ncbi:MAG: wax ester/triacylglycerol synthase family O-acyltransferase [Deltaproteobacteria bacterium]|nr:MAG: wax ester/triacylglycerol synthase family O-acyltransferase [Deltaproteobacteria bacterium]